MSDSKSSPPSEFDPPTRPAVDPPAQPATPTKRVDPLARTIESNAPPANVPGKKPDPLAQTALPEPKVAFSDPKKAKADPLAQTALPMPRSKPDPLARTAPIAAPTRADPLAQTALPAPKKRADPLAATALPEMPPTQRADPLASTALPTTRRIDTTAKPPGVNPAGLPPREPFPLASPAAPAVLPNEIGLELDEPSSVPPPPAETSEGDHLAVPWDDDEQADSGVGREMMDTLIVVSSKPGGTPTAPATAPELPPLPAAGPELDVEEASLEVGDGDQDWGELSAEESDELDSLLDEAKAEDSGVGFGLDEPAPAAPAPVVTTPSTSVAWASRARALEAEAARVASPEAKSRMFLAASELHALAGDRDAGAAAAAHAATLAPTGFLAQQQARAFAAARGDWKSAATALDAEARRAPTPAARTHAAYFAAEIQRLALDDAPAATRSMDQAGRSQSADARPTLHRLASQLGSDATPPKIRWGDDAELSTLARATRDLVRLRGGVVSVAEDAGPVHAFEEGRQKFAAGHPGKATDAILRLGEIEGLGRAAGWLAACLLAPTADTRKQSVDLLRSLMDEAPSPLLRRALASRALELGNVEAMRGALATPDEDATFSPADRVALAALVGDPEPIAKWAPVLAEDPFLRPLAAALAARAKTVAVPVGSAGHRALWALGSALIEATERARLAEFVAAVASAAPEDPTIGPLRLEAALDGASPEALAGLLGAVGGAEHEAEARWIAGFLRDLAGDAAGAEPEYAAAVGSNVVGSAAARVLAPRVDALRASELLESVAGRVADGNQRAAALLEAALRAWAQPERALALLDRAIEADPSLPFGYHLIELLARQKGDVAALVGALSRHREVASDPVEKAYDATREALLRADQDLPAAAALLAEASEARPADVALRELHERLSPGGGRERALWRVAAAEQATDSRTRSRLLLEAARIHERLGEHVEAEHAARRAVELGGGPLATLAAERLAARGPAASRLADDLLTRAKAEQDPRAQAELYERLAALDRARGESGALAWQGLILEHVPDHLPALRRLEHDYIGQGRDEELEPIVTKIVSLVDRKESVAHAVLAARLRAGEGQWLDTPDLVEVLLRHEPHDLWTLRHLSAHARAAGDDAVGLQVDTELSDRTTRPMEAAALTLRAVGAAIRLDRKADAYALLQKTREQVPDHLGVIELQADLLLDRGDHAGAAEALEDLVTIYRVDAHRGQAACRAGILWLDQVHDEARGRAALESALGFDIRNEEAFRRLHEMYVRQGERGPLAGLLERRLEATDDPAERIRLEVLRGQALAQVGDRAAARRALDAALEASPDHAEALDVYAELATADDDWAAAEQAWIRLARIAVEPERQADIYRKLARLYDTGIPNPQRAELCYREILKRLPNDVAAVEGLVQTYGKLGKPEKAVELQIDLVNKAGSLEDKRDRTLQLSRVYEDICADRKRAEATLDKARKAWPHDAQVLRELAELYRRHGETAAFNVLLDRSAMDARRALSTGRFEPAFFEILAIVGELKHGTEAAAVARATLAALEGRPSSIDGAGAKAGSPSLDDWLAPELLTGSFRALLQATGDALDAAYSVDLRSLRAAPLPANQADVTAELRRVATTFGINNLEVFVSPALGTTCMPVSSTPARIVFGSALLEDRDATARHFLVVRALKILQTRCSALSRTAPIDLWPVTAALLALFAPSWAPQGVDPKKFGEAREKIQASLPRRLPDEVPVLALEVIGQIGNRASQIATAIHQWGNRTALLSVGDPSIALDAIALAGARAGGPPEEADERLKWIVRNPEARDLAVFSVSEQFAEARRRAGLAG